MKVIDYLASLKYPTPPTEDNPCGTLSYLPARAQWADLQMLKIQRTMFDAGAIPVTLGIAICSANAPRHLPMAHVVEVGEAGPSGVSQIPRWESSLNLTMDATSHSTIVNLLLFLVTETGHSQTIQATVSKLIQDLIWKSTRQTHQIIRLYHIPQLPILLLFFMTAPGPLQQI